MARVPPKLPDEPMSARILSYIKGIVDVLVVLAGAGGLSVWIPATSSPAIARTGVIALAALTWLAARVIAWRMGLTKAHRKRFRAVGGLAGTLIVVTVGALIGHLLVRGDYEVTDVVAGARVADIVGTELTDAGRTMAAAHPEFDTVDLWKGGGYDASKVWTKPSIRMMTICMWTSFAVFEVSAVFAVLWAYFSLVVLFGSP